MNATVELSNDCDENWVPEISLCESWIASALDSAGIEKDCNISLRFVLQEVSAELNNHYRSKAMPTNVLSFPAEFPSGLGSQLDFEPLGDIVLCPQLIEQEAAEQGKPLQAHWAHLLIHGLLHLLGYQHDTGENAAAMAKLEINALERLGFPNPYLIG